MKATITLLGCFVGAALASGAAHARPAPPQSAAAQQTTPATQADTMQGATTGSTHFTTSDGTKVQVTSHLRQRAPDGPAPAFGTLDANQDRSISRSEAVAYALLADDFNYADGNENGSISESEYTRWVNMP